MRRSLQNIKILLFAFAAQHAFNVSYNGALSSVLCQIVKALLYACLCINLQERRSPNGSRSDVMLLMFVITMRNECHVDFSVICRSCVFCRILVWCAMNLLSPKMSWFLQLVCDEFLNVCALFSKKLMQHFSDLVSLMCKQRIHEH